MENKKPPRYSHLQLAFLGLVSILVGIICMLDTMMIYKLPALTSISQSATTGIRCGMILPFVLGCMFTFCISYVGYCKSEKILTRIMAIGFMVVAMQICNSEYVNLNQVGLFGLTPEISNILHCIGAVVGFGAMYIWIAFFFTRGVPEPTPRKLVRNKVYVVCAIMMECGIAYFVLGTLGFAGKHSVFIAEELMLIPAGFALIVKSGIFLCDKGLLVD